MLGGKNRIPYKVKEGRYQINSIKHIYELYKDNEKLKIWTKRRWYPTKVIKKDINKMYEVTYLGDNTIYYFDEKHLHKVLGEEKLQETNFLIPGDLIPFARDPFKDTSLFYYRKINEVKESKTTDKTIYIFEVKSSIYMLYGGLYVWNPEYYEEDK